MFPLRSLFGVLFWDGEKPTMPWLEECTVEGVVEEILEEVAGVLVEDATPDVDLGYPLVDANVLDAMALSGTRLGDRLSLLEDSSFLFGKISVN